MRSSVSFPFFASLLPLFAFVLAGASAERIYTIKNNCPSDVKLYINGKSQGTLISHKTVTKAFAETWSGLIYTSSNGGSAKGTGTTRAGFYGESGYYYIIQDPKKFNTGISVVPRINGTKGFCATDSCDIKNCVSAFSSPPTRFPGPESTPPTVPLYSCPGKKVGYTVTFCPSGYFPPPKGSVAIHAHDSEDKCLDVRASILKNGTPVQIFDCNHSPAQQWFIQKGGISQVRLAGTAFCLDAGKTPKNETPLKIWKCRENNAAQEWSYTDKNKIWLAKTDFVVDLRAGNLTNQTPVQIYRANPDATNQVWKTTKL